MSIDGGLRPLFRANMPQFMWTSIETGGTGKGISDSNYLAAGGVEGWIEYKITDGWAVTLEPEQIGFIERRVRLGGRTWIAVRRQTDGGPRSPSADELWLIPGVLARPARLGGLRCPEVQAACLRPVLGGGATYDGGPARWDWADVARRLAGKQKRTP